MIKYLHTEITKNHNRKMKKNNSVKIQEEMKILSVLKEMQVPTS